jgi:hypothetical protein
VSTIKFSDTITKEMVNKQFITNPNIQSPKILVFFTENYSLEEAVDLIKSWNPDTLSYDIVNRVPYVYAEKHPRFRLRVANLLKAGIKFQIGENILVPRLTNPPISNTLSIVQNQLPETQTREPIQEGRIIELERMLEQAMETIQVQRRELSQEREKNQIQDREITHLKNKVLILEQELASIKVKNAAFVDKALSPIPSRAVSPTPSRVMTPRVSPQVSPQVAPIPARVASPERPRVEVPQVDTDQVMLTDIESEILDFINNTVAIAKPYPEFDQNDNSFIIKQTSKGLELTINGLFEEKGKGKTRYRFTKKWNRTFIRQGTDANLLQQQLEKARNDLEALHIWKTMK